MLNDIYQLIAVPWSAILRRPITTKASGFTLTQSDKVKTFLDTLVKASKEDKYKERVNKLTRSFQQHGHTSDNIRKYQLIYNGFIKLAGSHAAKVARCKFGYERSPELTQKGSTTTPAQTYLGLQTPKLPNNTIHRTPHNNTRSGPRNFNQQKTDNSNQRSTLTI